jgi:hypothetical protein
MLPTLFLFFCNPCISTHSVCPATILPASRANQSKFRVARFFVVQHTKSGKNIPKGHKIYLMVTKYTEWTLNRPNKHKIYKHCPLQDLQKFTQTGIFVLKMYHLATLQTWPFGLICECKLHFVPFRVASFAKKKKHFSFFCCCRCLFPMYLCIFEDLEGHSGST